MGSPFGCWILCSANCSLTRKAIRVSFHEVYVIRWDESYLSIVVFVVGSFPEEDECRFNEVVVEILIYGGGRFESDDIGDGEDWAGVV